MDDLAGRLDRIEKDISCIKAMIEDLTMKQPDPEVVKGNIASQMGHLKTMFSTLPVNPEIKAQLDKIFDDMGAKS